RLESLEQNTDQLQFDLDGKPGDHAVAIQSPQLRPVITHFGSPEAGFTHASIGAPYKAKDGSCEWSWIEPFEDIEDGVSDDQQEADTPATEDPGEDFELQL